MTRSRFDRLVGDVVLVGPEVAAEVDRLTAQTRIDLDTSTARAVFGIEDERARDLRQVNFASR